MSEIGQRIVERLEELSENRDTKIQNKVSARNRLVIYRMSQLMASDNLGQTLENIKNINTFAKQAASRVDYAISVVRFAPDADPTWSDEDIAEIIVKNVSDRVCTCSPNDLRHSITCPARRLK